ncbi:MAG: hypothetical protein JST39_06450 [Bacteroidetes bacterium]|nr:hypothetical protein [Bacteroidota bacterium]
MQSIFPVKSMRALLPIAGLLFLSSIYCSCNQHVAHDQPVAATAKDSPTVDVDSKMPEETKKTEEVARAGMAVNSPEEAVTRFDEVKARYMELVKVLKDSTKANSKVVPYVYIQKMEKVRQDVDPVMTYFSRNRSKFSQAQIKHILNGTDEMARSISEVPRAQ